MRIYDGGLPLEPQPPWRYVASFSIEGLTNEYHGAMTILRDGELVDAPAFSEPEIVDFPPLGRREAFAASGGVSTAPWTFRGKLRNYDLKICGTRAVRAAESVRRPRALRARAD